jgi:hypothetical protein
VIAVVCAACQGSASQPPAPTALSVEAALPQIDAAALGWGPTDTAPPSTVAVPRTPATHELAKPLPAATHGRAISGIALSDDGTAALTIDVGNSVRLWPALDGTREPVAVPLAAPQETVLARSGDEFHIAALDTAGGLVLLRVDANGQLVGKASMDRPDASS